jgi:hypothetical protein
MNENSDPQPAEAGVLLAVGVSSPPGTAEGKIQRWIANTLREEWNQAAAKVGVRVRMYEGTKHSSATAWLAQGSSLQMIQRMLRHADSRSTERYAKLGELALVDVIRPRNRSPRETEIWIRCGSSRKPASQTPRSTTESGGADGTRTRPVSGSRADDSGTLERELHAKG